MKPGARLIVFFPRHSTGIIGENGRAVIAALQQDHPRVDTSPVRFEVVCANPLTDGDVRQLYMQAGQVGAAVAVAVNDTSLELYAQLMGGGRHIPVIGVSSRQEASPASRNLTGLEGVVNAILNGLRILELMAA